MNQGKVNFMPPRQLLLNRRNVSLMLCAAPALASCGAKPTASLNEDTAAKLTAIEKKTGGRIGVAAINLSDGSILQHRGDERFAMCSTFKWLLAGFILQRCDAGTEDLSRRIDFSEDDLVYFSPVTKEFAGKGGMSVGQMCEATVQRSDNTAANLLLASMGGPDGFTALARDNGDAVTRLDRLEPNLNENKPGDPRDTTSPRAMAEMMKRFIFGEALSAQSSLTLRNWMIGANTGLDRLRAGLPADWIAGDKTGTSDRDANNDVAFAIPPDGAQENAVIIISFTNAPNPVTAEANGVHADIAEAVMRRFL